MQVFKQKTPSVDFGLKWGVIILPFRINSTERKLFFDKGSSPFQLVTSKENALKISEFILLFYIFADV